MRPLLVVLLVALALSVAATGITVWWASRVLRRLCRRTRWLVDRGSLSLKSHLAPGSGRQVSTARLGLHASIEQTRRVLDEASRRNVPLGDLPGLFHRIEHLAGCVDADLQLLDGDRDPRQQARLVAVLARGDELTSMAAGIRHTVSAVHAEMESDGFGLLQRDLSVELRALRAGAAAAGQPVRDRPVL